MVDSDDDDDSDLPADTAASMTTGFLIPALAMSPLTPPVALVALAAMRRLPMAVEPMVVSSRGIGELQSGASNAKPVPLTTLTTPAGMPVPSISWHAKLVASGVT